MSRAQPASRRVRHTGYEGQPKNPQDLCRLFQQYMHEGDIDSVLSVYEADAVFLNRDRKLRRGLRELREELAPFIAAKARFDYEIKEIIEADDVALMHTHWHITGSHALSVYAIEVARRQPDGTWRWLIGDPFTVGRLVPV